MSTDQTRVVITGLGAISPVGADVATTWKSLLAGRSGVVQLTDSWAGELPARIAAPAAADPAALLDRVQARRMDRCEQLGLVAAREAWADAGAPEVDPGRLGVVASSGMGGATSVLSAYETLREKGWQQVSPFTVPMIMPNGPAGWISLELGARAGVHTTVSACASGAEAIGYGMDMIRLGRADVVWPAAPRPRSSRSTSPRSPRCGLYPGATTNRSAPPGPSTRAGTASCSARVPGWSCWSPPSTLPAVARPCTRSPPGSATRPTPITSRSQTRPAPASCAPSAGHSLTAGSARSGRACQRACHFDPGRRCCRGPGNRRRARNRGPWRGRLGHQVDDGTPARRGGRGGVRRGSPCPPRPGRATYNQPRRPRRPGRSRHSDRAEGTARPRERADGRAQQLVRIRRAQCRACLHRRLAGRPAG